MDQHAANQQSAINFMVKVIRKPELAQELRNIDPKDFPALSQIATREGFHPFDQDDYYFAADKVGGEWSTWAARARGDAPSGDISDAELEQIAGGKGLPSWLSGGSFCLVSDWGTEPNWCSCDD